MSKKINILIHFIITLMCLLFYFHFMIGGDFISESFCTILLLFIFGWIFISLNVYDISYIHPYGLYLLVLFLYNIGGFFISAIYNESFFDYEFGLSAGGGFSKIEQGETIFCILFYLIFSHWGVIIYDLFKRRDDENNIVVSDNNETCNIYRKVGLVLFYVSLLPAYYYYYIYIKEAFMMGGYHEYALSGAIKSGTTNLNIFFRIADDINKIGFILFLSSLPSKRRFILPSILYIIPFILLTVFTGSRVHAITQGMMLLSYFILVYSVPLKKIVTLLLVFILFSAFIGFARNFTDYNVDAMSDAISESDERDNMFYDFFSVQGLSAQTITMTISMHNQGLLDFSPSYVIMPLFTSGGYEEGKLYSDYYYLPDKISYNYNDRFTIGGGLGGSIIADFYAVGGIFGVIILSIILSFIFFKLIEFITIRKSPLGMSILLCLLPGIFYLPRAYFLYPIINAKFILIFMFLFYIFTLHSEKNMVRNIQ